MDKNNRMLEAFENFKDVTDPKGFNYENKFRFLPGLFKYESDCFLDESKNNLRKKYYYYKRGSIIWVNFGVNLGSEFSNPHFAVVLDKHDSPRKRTLTVLPITSKAQNDRFSLGDEIFEQTIVLLKSHVTSLEQRLYDNIKITESRRLSGTLSSANNPNEIDPAIQKLNDKMTSDIKQLKEVVDRYTRYNKKSYVRLSDITTISKLRIYRLNKFDPSGKIRLSKQQMALLSQKLAKLYLSKYID